MNNMKNGDKVYIIKGDYDGAKKGVIDYEMKSYFPNQYDKKGGVRRVFVVKTKHDEYAIPEHHLKLRK
jgi:hypothetical protein